MICTICETKEAVPNEWCDCVVCCEHCLRGTILATGVLQCTHCRRLKPASPRQKLCFLGDVFARRYNYKFACEVLQDKTLTFQLLDFMAEHKMDCRNFVRVIPNLEARFELALRIVQKMPELYRELPFRCRQLIKIARVAILAEPTNAKYCEAPPFDAALVAAKKNGLRDIADLSVYSDDERKQLYNAAFTIKGNTDILGVNRHRGFNNLPRKYWMIAIKATPLLLCRVPNVDAESVSDILKVCEESKSFGIYEHLSEAMRSDKLLASHLLTMQVQYKTSFNFLRWTLCKPAKPFTVAALQTCAQGLRYAGIGDYDYSDALSCVERDGLLLECVPVDCVTFEMCAKAVAQNGLALKYCLQFRDNLRIQLLAVRQNKEAIVWADRSNALVVHEAMPLYVKKYGVDANVAMSDLVDAVKDDPDFLEHIPKEDHTPALVCHGNKKFAHPFFQDDVSKREFAGETLLSKFITSSNVDVASFDPRHDDI